ncbi:uncharacterized protein RJT20DRAFT_151230 [Scheffersomyces xylosifermentans]|uniref:uncharacterized protein n=1 Tax=Scheffersomyces xylosifermentans TaxID=1304137 RepID=UPI00315D0805
MLIQRLLVIFACLSFGFAKRSLSASSLVTCMDNSQISPTYFNVTFNPDDRSLRYSLDLTTEVSGFVLAHVQVYAYGFLIIEKNIDMCSLGWKQFCPVYPGSLQVESIEYISEEYANQIPGIAFTVPDIDAVVKVVVMNRSSGEQVSCLQASFTNGKTVSQTGAKWATAIIAGLGLLIAAILSTFGNSNAASHISANSVALFLYFQSVVVVSMQHVVRVPPIASAWSENLAWSMGLIRVQFMQNIFRWYVQSTGGTPTLFFTGTTKQILVQRALDYLDGLHKRALNFGLKSNTNLFVLRGIKRIGYNSKIEPTSIVVTGFTFFILVGYLLVAILVVVKSVLELLIRMRKINARAFTSFRLQFPTILKGSILRYIYIGFTQLVILSLWEFTQRDSAAVIVLAVLFLILPISVIAYSYWKVIQYGRLSVREYDNPAALLYGDAKILNKYGYCYTMFNAEKYWFGIVLIGYNFIKALFIGLCQASGKTSVLVFFIVDLAYTIYLIYSKPYLNKPTNILSYLISVVTTLNSFLFLFFSDLFGQPAPVSSIMGWVFFVLNAGFSLVLLIFILVYVAMSIISKNPDARFAPAKDDRFSFQRKSSVKHRKMIVDEKQINTDEDESTTAVRASRDELSALGIAAQDHANDWESQMYHLNNIPVESGSINQNMLTPDLRQDVKFAGNDDIELEKSSLESLGERRNSTFDLSALRDKITRRFSRGKMGTDSDYVAPKATAETKNISRMSDTLMADNEEADDFNTFTQPRNHAFAARSSSKHNRHESNISNVSLNNSNQPMDTNRIL